MTHAEQSILRRSRILIAGVGGLGAPAALRLAAAGVGTLVLVDFDVVELSNLHRQILYRTPDIGRLKVGAAAERLAAWYPGVAVQGVAACLAADNVAALFRDVDFIIDGTDRIESKYLVNDAAVLSGVPFSYGGIVGFQGQTLTVLPGRTACLRCLFPSLPPPDDVPTCQEAGVIGALAGSIGVLQAADALKSVLGIGGVLGNRLLTYDATAARWRAVALARNRDCPLCGDRPTIRHLETPPSPPGKSP